MGVLTPALSPPLRDQFPDSFRGGALTETRFIASARQAGLLCTPTEQAVDSYKHVDLWVDIQGKRYGVDIKGMKRLSRGGNIQDRYTCLELHGNYSNSLGWLKGGSAALIAFETRDKFLMVWRDRLVIVANFFISPERVKSSSEAIYCIYNRKGSEQITWVETGILGNPWLLFQSLPKVTL